MIDYERLSMTEDCRVPAHQPSMIVPMPVHFLPRRLTLLALAFCLSVAVGCSSKDAAPPEDLPAEELYSRGQAAMEAANFEEAAKSFEEVERQHPYSQWATRGQIMAAYSYYEANKYDGVGRCRASASSSCIPGTRT